MINNADQPAFIHTSEDIERAGGSIETEHYTGLTKREWFAGMAMQGILLNNHWVAQLVNDISGKSKRDLVIELSYEYADAMLKENSG